MGMGWDVYVCDVDGAPAVISLDLDLREAAERGTHPQRLHVRHAFHAPRANGLPDGTENDAMYALQDALVAALTEGADAVYLACMNNHGYREHFFQLPPHSDGRAVVAKVEAESADYELETFSEDDPAWAYYTEFLWPDPRTMQYLMDRRVLQSLAENGDRHDVPRPVDHYLDVPDERSGRALLAEARAAGFGGVVEEREGRQGPEGRWQVRLQRDDAVELDHIHAVVWGLYEMAERFGGGYDGWGCVVAK